VEYRLLGPVAVSDHGRDVDLGGLRERALLARMLLSANLVVSADLLAHDLWSGDPPPHSAATLRVYVSRLRRALGATAAALVTRPPGYRLNVADGDLDTTRFLRLTHAAGADLAAGRPQAAAAALREALAMWRGPALSDVSDLPFAQAEVTRLEEARLTALEDRVEADLRCGLHASLTAELDALVATHPLRERLTGQRMLALYRCGRQAEALAAYGELRARLAGELGIDPSAALQRRHEAILRQDHELDWRPRAHPPGRAPAGRATASGAGPAGEAGGAAVGRGGAGRPAPGPAAGSPASGGLPVETTSFIGREEELATVGELLRLSRLVTLTGPGGSGKSRLALRVAAQAAASFPAGVWLVELAPIERPDLVLPVVGSALAVREQPGAALLDSVIARLPHAGAGQALLVLDNCEHVADAVAGLASVLLRGCTGLRILATSQTRLTVAGEATWPVPPLSVPQAGAREPGEVATAESARLFCDRAALARPGFALTPGNSVEIGEICRRLDGIPLAIELAAARVSALTVGQLSARLSDRFRVLTGGSRVGLPRHRTLEAAIEWSHDLLSPEERVGFRRLAVFAGGCTIDAAEAVCPDAALPPDLVFETVTALVDRSLLTTEERAGSMRYGMLESIRHYAAARLAEAGERPALQQRHLAWLAGLAQEADLDGADQAAWLDLLEADLDNVRAALEWGMAPAGDPAAALTLAGAMAPFWVVRGPAGPGRDWLAAALAATGPQPSARARALALDGAAALASVQADHAAAQAYQRDSLALWRGLGDHAKVASCLGDLGALAHIRGGYAEALDLYTEALALARQAGEGPLIARCLSGLGRLGLHQGNLAEATAYYTESMARFREAGDLRRATLILGNLGVVAMHAGEFGLAQQRLAEHLGNARRLGDRKLIGGALTNLGMVAYDTGDLDRAEPLHAEALAVAQQLGDRRLESVALTNLGVVALARKDYQAARERHLRSLALSAEFGERRAIAESLEELAQVETAAGDAARAAVLIGASEAIRAAIGSPIPAADIARFDAAAAAAAAALGPDAFAAASGRGRAMTDQAAVEFASGELRQRQDLVAVLRHDDGVLELRGPLAVLGDRGPAVRPDVVLDRAQRQHRLDRERHPRLHHDDDAGVVEVGHDQAGVERGPDPVPGEVPHHPVPEPVGVGLDDPADGVERPARGDRPDAPHRRLAGALDQQP
jgi:predicted ATPase/DNA-binding SARP family transcriptional activator